MSPDTPSERRPARILIVDDEPHNIRLIEVMLEAEGYQLLTAGSGREALDIVAAQPVDLILLDVMMPGMDGYQVTTAIKAKPETRHIRIILLTALNDRNSRMHGLSAGAEEFQTKPVSRAELSKWVRRNLPPSIP